MMAGSFALRLGARQDAVARLDVQLGVLPSDYVRFLLKSNGGEGRVGESGHLAIWPAEEIADLNQSYAVNELSPGIVLIGSDGGGIGYAFDYRDRDSPSVIDLPLDGVELEYAREAAGNSGQR